MGNQGLKRRASDGDGGWAVTGMRWLGTATQIVEISLVWWLATILGGVLLGWLPASVAAVSVLSRLGTDEESTSPLGDFFRVWRSQFLRTNAVGWPATVAFLTLGLNTWVLSVGGRGWMVPMLGATVAVWAWLVLAVAYLTVLLAHGASRHQPQLRLWRAALSVPLTSPGTAVAWALSVASLFIFAWRFPILVPLAVPGLVQLLTAWMMGRQLDQTGILTPDDSRTTTSKSA